VVRVAGDILNHSKVVDGWNIALPLEVISCPECPKFCQLSDSYTCIVDSISLSYRLNAYCEAHILGHRNQTLSKMYGCSTHTDARRICLILANALKRQFRLCECGNLFPNSGCLPFLVTVCSNCSFSKNGNEYSKIHGKIFMSFTETAPHHCYAKVVDRERTTINGFDQSTPTEAVKECERLASILEKSYA
jgi:hypothetical protein